MLNPELWKGLVIRAAWMDQEHEKENDKREKCVVVNKQGT
jgi:hypothetical protein